MRFWLAAGSSFTSGTARTTWGSFSGADIAVGQTAQVGDNVADTWQITGVQLEVGSVATPFEHRSYADELKRCMRYYQTSTDNINAALNANVSPSGYCHANIHFKVQMRATPTVNYTWSGNGGNVPNQQSTSAIGLNSFVPLAYANTNNAFVIDTWNASAEL